MSHTYNSPEYSVARSRRSGTAIAVTLVAVLCFALLFGIFYFAAGIKPVLPQKVAAKHIQQWLSEPPRFENPNGSYARLFHRDELRRLYRSNRYRTIWFDNYGLNAPAQLLIQSLRETVADDRYLYSYHLPAILKAEPEIGNLPARVTALDLLLSDAFLTFIQDIRNNNYLPDLKSHDHQSDYRVVAEQVTERWTSDQILYELQQKLDAKSLLVLLKSLTPSHAGYLKLREQLEYYQRLDLGGHWETLGDGPVLKPGDSHPDIRVIKNNLLLFGDYSGHWFSEERTLYRQEVSFNPSHPVFVFDDEMEQAVRHYQLRNGLQPTGWIDEATRLCLQQSPQRIARRIALNMKRWRHLPDRLGPKYVMVNMADFRLQVVADDQPLASMKVIVGRTDRRTPTIIGSISSLVLNPTWTVPGRIAVRDILPQIRKNPAYLTDKHLQLIRYDRDGTMKTIDPATVNWQQLSTGQLPFTFRQAAGPDNALGMVKFVIPNNMAIYLHDTNHRNLFSQDMRALSSGCVRVEKPELLARLLLQDTPSWQEERLTQVIQSQRTTYVKLSQPVPTYLMYWTAWVDDEGVLQQRPDVYQWDALDKFGSDYAAAQLASNIISTLSP
ncbi:L,D-transpeptidase family protein [Gynuella sunshinyii]|uniref:L,D-TPase catalytic domain-containing protein n=1 Tax=Gynuella sunshinyii YC6258 TaxID=1445510 RepID=A0A0C5VU93_9GAMM|nr:L,D-transpeptidase family protein [Gynuella sunshinyii]AJQ97726.1 hypothetical protein YC6258_05698 [Gynuella sunshinyii YC6258]